MLKSSEENVKTCQFEFENVVPLICNGSDLGYFCHKILDHEQRLFNS